MLQLFAVVSCSISLLLTHLQQIPLTNKLLISIINGAYSFFQYLFIFLYICSWLYLCRVFYVIYGSLYHLRKKRFIKYTKPVAWIYEKFFHKEFYEKNYRPRQAFQTSLIGDADISLFQKVKNGGTILLLYEDTFDYSSLISEFIRGTVNAKETIDYVITYKNPIDLCKDFSDDEVISVTKGLSIIDCFTPHYGFDDKVNKFYKRDLTQKGFVFFDATSFSEIHTAANNSWYRFRKVCKNEENSYRVPHRTVYDTVSSLIRFSSEEQYMLFMRHVISSERSYGMISLIVEPISLAPEVKNDLIRMSDVVLTTNSSNITVLK